mmetsp:Transcript_5699/g.10219  ORF Transcript_5699/g.10219 Transcript_5699/m.10219 type:complete len:550 (-) Transcript_5699:56-1705(-)|eukprot:CAMPEP_0184551794 /NCGR_PEP_ID=MMETSP0199_2-20130426/26628_1 /TAXON_ID=1112570 /ORGANISM="Thraustochytrium sp., Strain LLF1b" /LENGTH=549 /DNA_ID=CAMNT_0026947095 /DNA_START=122 /DNA_END=1771 /DNA_ORIENTATION=-
MERCAPQVAGDGLGGIAVKPNASGTDVPAPLLAPTTAPPQPDSEQSDEKAVEAPTLTQREQSPADKMATRGDPQQGNVFSSGRREGLENPFATPASERNRNPFATVHKPGANPFGSSEESFRSPFKTARQKPPSKWFSDGTPFTEQMFRTCSPKHNDMTGSNPPQRTSSTMSVEEPVECVTQDTNVDEMCSSMRQLKRLKSLDVEPCDARDLLLKLSRPRNHAEKYGFQSLERFALYDFGVCAVQGPRVSMEDRFSVVGKLSCEPYYSYYAVFDGHGGSSVAEECAESLHETLQASIKSFGIENPEAALTDAFETFDTQVRAQQTTNRDSLVGSTAVVAVLGETECYLANVGDSRALLVQKGSGNVVQLSRDHKPSTEEEKHRIEAAGGTVKDNRVDGILSMSRAIGDQILSKYVIATPQVTIRKFSAEDEYLVLGSDGLWDIVKNNNVASIVKCSATPQVAADALVAASSSAHSNDNITVVVISLRQVCPTKQLVAKYEAFEMAESQRLEEAKRREEEQGKEDAPFALSLPILRKPPGKRQSLRLDLS